MTSLERIQKSLIGERADRQPTVSLNSMERNADVVVVELAEVDPTKTHEQVVLARIRSPLARSIEREMNLVELLRSSPEVGARILSQLVREAKDEFESANSFGADGVCYVLKGASPEFTTPMEYGGFYLERDRELLSSIAGSQISVLFVDGPSDYFDFVSDLPAQALAFQSLSGTWDLEQVRSLWHKPIIADLAGADFMLEDALQLAAEPERTYV